MSPNTVIAAIEKAIPDAHQVMRLVEGLDAIHEGLRVGWYAHTKYLPARRDLLNYMQGQTGSRLSLEFKRLRGRVGGTTRWQVARHEKSFRASLGFLGVPDPVINSMWIRLKPAILRALSTGRAGQLQR